MERRIPEWHGWHAARRGLRTWCQARAKGLLEQIPGTEPVTVRAETRATTRRTSWPSAATRV